jgi:hypothetical protein
LEAQIALVFLAYQGGQTKLSQFDFISVEV